MATRLEGSDTKIIFVFFLEVVWAIEQLLSGIFGAYMMARAVSIYEKTHNFMDPIVMQTKARFNEENFQILNLLQKQQPFKVIFFQIDKDIKKNKDKKYGGIAQNVGKGTNRVLNRMNDLMKLSEKQRAAGIAETQKCQEMVLNVRRDVQKYKCYYYQERQ